MDKFVDALARKPRPIQL